MGNFYTDNEDLRYYVEKDIDWVPIVTHRERNFTDKDGFKSTEEATAFYREILELVGGFVADDVAPHVRAIDEEGATHVAGEVHLPEKMETIMGSIAEMGLHKMCFPRELGGMNAPELINHLQSELFGRADVSIMAHHGFHAGIALVLFYYSMEEGSTERHPETGAILKTRWHKEIAEILEGKAWGSMDITEPDAGSDMAALRTRAVLGEDGVWRLTGQKIFITSGHGKYHVVIAKTEEPQEGSATAGLEGLSLFMVRAYEDDAAGNRTRYATVERVEEKLGHHASATCTIGFQDTPGELIGKRGEGFRYMLKLMNSARVGVGFECLSLCEAATRLAREYASGRSSMGKTIDKHEMIAAYLDDMELKTRAVRAMAVNAAWQEEMSRSFGEKALGMQADSPERLAVEKDAKRHGWKARSLTPLLKYQAAEYAVEISRMGVQIHGGVGYTTEYGAEKLVRDSLGMPIYEGTSQIQSLMVMKDALQRIMKSPQRFVGKIAQARLRSLSPAATTNERRVARLEVMGLKAQQVLLMRSASRKLNGVPLTRWSEELFADWDPKRDFAFAMLHAENLTRIFVDVAVARIFASQAERHPERMEWFERWVEGAEPRARYHLECIEQTGKNVLRRLNREATDGE